MDAIVAVYDDWGIGCEGDQPIALDADRKFFRRYTAGSTVIVGRKTLGSFPGQQPLPKRRNIVLTRQEIDLPGFEVARSPEEAAQMCAGDEKVFVIGGGTVYRQMLPQCERAIITKVHTTVPCDTLFPNLDELADWKLTETIESGEENGIAYDICIYERKAPKRTVIITGATDGIGKSLAIALSKEYNLGLCGRSEEKMKQVIRELGDCPVYADCFDITDGEKRRTFCENVKREFASVDVLVNGAGANTKKDKIVDINLDDLRSMFELNCVSAVGMIQNVYPMMAEKRSGLIVNILSSCCLFNNPMTGSYSASKDAMEGISKILTKEARKDHIGVCNVYPGGVDTNFRATANPDYLRPETVARMIKSCIENEDGCVHDIVIRPFIEENMP